MASKSNESNKEKWRKRYATRNAMDKILSSSARHQAQQRMNYITENGIDRDVAQLSRKELNSIIGSTETENLRWQSRHGGVRDYPAERAAQRTKAKKNAESKLKDNAKKKTETSRDRVKKVFEGAEGRKALEQALAAQKKKQKK